MNFKAWLEWEGFNPVWHQDFVNGPEFPGSKYFGKYPRPKSKLHKKINDLFGKHPDKIKDYPPK